jgi:hypothetical protein
MVKSIKRQSHEEEEEEIRDRLYLAFFFLLIKP